jgi:putative salt-induced outer membrane protein
MRRSLLLGMVVLLFASVALAAEVDKVTLKNGDRYSGTIVSADGKILLLKTEFAGDVTVKWDAITAIESAQNLHLTLKDGQRLSGKVSTTDGKFVVAGTEATAAPADKDSIVAVRNDVEQKNFDTETEKMAHPKFNYFWSGLLDTGLALTSGNSSALSYTLSTTAVRETPRNKLTVYSTYIYANDNSTPPNRTTANDFRGGVRGDLNVSPRIFLFALADFETNQLQHLNLRQVYGGGLGYHVIKNDRTTFDVFGGASYDRDSFGQYFLLNPLTFFPGQKTNSAEILVGEELHTKIATRTTLSERFVFYPNMSNLGQYRYQLTATSATIIKKWLSWQITLTDGYLSNPPFGLKSNDLLLSTGLRVAWGKNKL